MNQGLLTMARRVRDEYPDHEPFIEMCTKMKHMSADDMREALDVYLLPVASKLQKKDLDYFVQDPTFRHLRLVDIDLQKNPGLVDEVFTMLNHTLLLSSTMALLPDNLLDVAQNMASQMSGAVQSDGTVDQGAMSNILSTAMQAAGLNRPVASLTEESATEKLKQARRHLM